MVDTLPMVLGDTVATAQAADNLLAARCVRGDTAAFDELVRLHRERVAGLAFRLLGWRHDIEDVVQDVFVIALENLPKFRGESRLRTWLFRITANRCRRALRRPRLLRGIVNSPPVASEGERLDRETAAQVRAAVAALPVRDREVVVLRYLEDLPIEEIGQLLGLSRNAVDVRLNRARRRLRPALSSMLED